MIISHSQIGLSADHHQSRQVHERESLQRFEADAQGNVRVSASMARNSMSQENTSSLRPSASAAARIEQSTAPQLPALKGVDNSEVADEEIDRLEPRLRLLAAIIGIISNRKIELFDTGDLHTESKEASASPINAPSFTPPPPAAGQTGMRYEWSREITATESTGFSAVGKLTTADGKSIDIALDLQMEYRRTSRESLVVTAGVQLKDPLVINFNGTAAELTAERLSFDIDADGQKDSINALSPNSGLLMLDRNGDGIANDGRELFGALSGDGFADLARYDEDGNGFIDEGDSVYGELKIWIRQTDGSDRYIGLKEGNVGALYLGSVATPFSLYTEGDRMRGQIRASGLYVGENGSVGTLQQIDLVV